MVYPLTKPFVSMALVGVVLAVLGGCREEEMGRPLFHEKGSYAGPADEPLPPEAHEQMKRRINGQRASGI